MNLAAIEHGNPGRRALGRKADIHSEKLRPGFLFKHSYELIVAVRANFRQRALDPARGDQQECGAERGQKANSPTEYCQAAGTQNLFS
jgi:hypothetical protein